MMGHDAGPAAAEGAGRGAADRPGPGRSRGVREWASIRLRLHVRCPRAVLHRADQADPAPLVLRRRHGAAVCGGDRSVPAYPFAAVPLPGDLVLVNVRRLPVLPDRRCRPCRAGH